MRKVFILYSNFYTLDGKELAIGGIQTYIKMLVDVIKKNNMIPVIYQYADTDFIKNYNDVEVNGIKVKKCWSEGIKSRFLLKACKKKYDPNNDIIIFATHSMGIRNREKRVIGIQHGITCDIRKLENYSHIPNVLFGFLRTINSYYRNVFKVRYFNVLVCVDYNFLNWYRTKLAHTEVPVRVIPNCTSAREFTKKEDDNKIKIIFARRFYQYRGTTLFAPVLKRLLEKYENVYATFAGDGPDKDYLKKMFEGNERVQFIKYDSENSIEIHKDYQIAVIPTIGSEGTSLSLLEAMAAKCAVVASNVGGITNIILDHYNGLLVNPDDDELYDALEELINNADLRKRISEAAFNTVEQAFNKELWEKRWTNVLNSLC